MLCPDCGASHVKKNGLTSKGVQKFKCKECTHSFVETPAPNRLTADDHRFILEHHAEGVSIRGIARLLGKCSWFAVWAFLKKRGLQPAPARA